MVTRILGFVLMGVGILLALGCIYPLLASVIHFTWILAKFAMMVFVAYVGYRLLRLGSVSEA